MRIVFKLSEIKAWRRRGVWKRSEKPLKGCAEVVAYLCHVNGRERLWENKTRRF